MAYEFRKPARIRVLAQGAADSFAVTRLTADYQTFTAAMADIANWDALIIAPGTYTFTSETLAAGKAIIGLDRDTCILQTDQNTLDAAALSCGNQSYLQDIYVRGRNAGGTNRIHLIDFGGAVAGQYIVMQNCRVDNGGGTQPYRLDAPVYATGSRLDLYQNQDRGIGVADASSSFFGTALRATYSGAGGSVFLLSSTGGLTFCGCSFIWVAGTVYAIWDNGGVHSVTVAGCTVSSNFSRFITVGGGATSYAVCGSALGAGNSLVDVTATPLRFAGNVNYGTSTSISLAATSVVAQMDVGLFTNHTAASSTIRGFPTLVYCSRTSAITETMPACANFGAPFLVIKDYGGNQGRYNITCARSSTDVFDNALTSYVIRENYGWTYLVKNEYEAPDQWNIVSTSRETLSHLMGDLQVYGFMQEGTATADGTVGLRGEDLFGDVNVSPAGTYGVDANGGYLKLASTGVAGNLMYAYTAAPNGPLPETDHWDLVFFWECEVQHNDQRIAMGAIDISGHAVTVFLDASPDRPCVLVQKPTAGSAAQLYVSSDDGGVVTTAAFATWAPAADTSYYVWLRKRSGTYTAYIYTAAGVFVDFATLTPATDIVNTADLAVVCGMMDTSGAAGRDFKIRSMYGHQIQYDPPT